MAKIVLADDDEDLRAIYGAALRSAGYQVWEAPDGQSALDLIHRHHPDLLLLDIWMPSVNGFEVLDLLRHDPIGNRLRIIVISNLNDADTRLEAFEGGIVEYLVKGISLEAFLRRVQDILNTTDLTLLGEPPASSSSAPGPLPA